MNEVQRKLNAFLDRSAKYAFAWGDHDCMLDIADWLDYSCGLRVAEEWRGNYATEDELDELMDSLGGFEQAMRDEADRLELVEAAEPLLGDPGLLNVSGQPKILGGILMPSGRWRMRTLTGFLVTSAVTVVVAWSLPCRPSLPQPS
jgi:hypothetical protein